MRGQQSHLSRRQLVRRAGGLGLALLAGCGRLPWQAQPAVKVYKVGVITLGSPTAAAVNSAVDSFRQGMHDYGYVEGQNLVIETRFAEGSTERLPALANELAGLPVDVLVVTSSPTVQAAQAATRTIPIVVAIGGDLIEAGYAAGLARPGGNVTGISDPIAGLSGKRLQLLKEAVPTVSRVAVPWNTASLPHTAAFADTQQAAGILGMQLISLELSGATPDLEAAFESAVAEGADGLLALPSDIIAGNSGRIVALASKHRLPSMFPLPLFVAAGGLMAYGPNHVAMHRRAAYFVDRILRGTNPANLPVEQPREFDFAINLNTAQALGLTIPEQVLRQATEVIQ
jgi:putative tryptophan/tyrosine transport system substrate-binding protein